MNIRSKVLVAAALCAAGATLLGKARAGLRETFPVMIMPSNMIAFGSLADTRNSSDNVSYLSCDTYVMSPGSTPSALCLGTDSSGHSFYCSTSDPGLVQMAGNVKGDSYIWVAWNSSGLCSALEVYNGSYFSPKGP